MELKVNGLCLKSVDYLENDKLITLSTLEKGKLLVSAKGVRREKAKLKLAASPLCFGEYILTESRGKLILTGCSPVSVFFDCWGNPDKYIAAMILTEVLDKITLPDVAAPELTLQAVRALADVEDGEIYPPAVCLAAVVRMVRLAGFASPAGYFADNREAEKLFSGLDVAVDDMIALDLTEFDIRRAFKLLSYYFGGHLDLKIKSIAEYLKN